MPVGAHRVVDAVVGLEDGLDLELVVVVGVSDVNTSSNLPTAKRVSNLITYLQSARQIVNGIITVENHTWYAANLR